MKSLEGKKLPSIRTECEFCSGGAWTGASRNREEPQCGHSKADGRGTRRPSQAAVEFRFYFVGDRMVLKDFEQRK